MLQDPRPFLPGTLALATRSCFENAASTFGAALSFFGFLISRVLRSCPLAMLNQPFEVAVAINFDGFEIVFGRHALVAFVFTADSVLQHSTARRQRPHDDIELGGRQAGRSGFFVGRAGRLQTYVRSCRPQVRAPGEASDSGS